MQSLATIIFLDKNSIITSNKSTFERHSQYAIEFRELYHSEIIVFQSRQGKDLEISFKSESLTIHKAKSSKWNLVARVIEYRRFLNTFQDRKISFICGDPWRPVLQLLFLRTVGWKRYPFQVQVHFDIFDPKWRRASLRNFIKYILALPGLYGATNLRFVSEHQASSLRHRFLLRRKKLFVTPVPLNLQLTEIVPNSVPRSRSIGFLGRLSKDRGVQYLEFVARAIKNSDIRMIIAGSGPELAKVKETLSRILQSHRIEFSGYLEGSELTNFWRSIGVLVSTAESESFGRSIRESLCHGVPVVALNSLGAQQIKNGPLGEFIHLYDKITIQNLTLDKIENCLIQNVGSLALRMEIEASLVNRKKLYASWSELNET